MNLSIAWPSLRLPSAEKRHWLAGIVLVTMVALYVFAGLSLALLEPGRGAHAKIPGGVAGVPGLGTPPKAEPMRFREIAPQDAIQINAAVPVSTLPNPAARPFAVTFASPADSLRALECLTAAVYYEAAIEPLEGQRAVAQVVLNRVRHPAYPSSVCGVVFQGSERVTGCQFTFTCDGAIRRTPAAALWARAKMVAAEALAGKVYAPVGWATHYHTNWVVPYWSSSLVKAAIVGTHIFYRWEGGWGRPHAFRARGGGSEPQFAKMRHLTTDPSSLADAPAVPTPEEAAALAAAQAAAAASPTAVLTSTAPVPTELDISKRAVIRRYEPMTREAATAAAIARTKEPASASLHWALSGVPAKPTAGLGKKSEGDASPAEPPRCLEGVRKLPSGTQGPAAAQAQRC
jgi:spore germination cell wall hydrolase CwlJ-like protein